MNTKFFSFILSLSLLLTLVAPFSKIASAQTAANTSGSTQAPTNEKLTQDLANVNQMQKQYEDMVTKSRVGDSMQSSPTGAVNYGQAFGGCIGKIVGKYIANYLGLGIGAAVNAISNLFATTATTAKTAETAAQGVALVASVPTYSAPAYFSSTADYALQEDARRQAQSDNTAKNFLTPLAVCIANELVTAMTQSTVSWINNGFRNPDGTKGPGFVSNPSQFFQGIADREVGGFFQGLGPMGSVLCKPFDVKVRLALLNEYRGSYGQQAQCSLASIQKNFQNFGRGANGGNGNYWNDWFELTQRDQNNYMGSYFLARDQLARNVAYNQNMNRLEITLSQGFLAIKKCPTGGTKCDDKDKITTTPGKEVQASLDRVLTIQGNRINIANSFDDIINALVGQMLKMAVGGLQGNKK